MADVGIDRGAAAFTFVLKIPGARPVAGAIALVALLQTAIHFGPEIGTVFQQSGEGGDNADEGADKQKNGRPGDNRAQNKQVRDAAREAGLSPEQRRKLGRQVEMESRELGENLGFRDIVGIAQEIKSGLR